MQKKYTGQSLFIVDEVFFDEEEEDVGKTLHAKDGKVLDFNCILGRHKFNIFSLVL